MQALADAIEAHAEELAQIESLDNGKPVGLAQYVDVNGAIAHLRYFAGWPTKIEGGVLPVAAPNMHCYTRREPVGVCGQIIPWNFPLLMAAWKLGPGARGRLHGRAQAGRADAAERAADRRAGAGGRLPAGRPERAHRRRRDRRGAGRSPRRRQDRLHRLDRRRARDRREGRQGAQARDAGARRQVAEHHPPRRRHRRGGQGLLSGDLLQLRPGLQRRLAPVRAGRALRRGDERAGRRGQERRGSARASIPARSSGRSSRPSSTSACSATSRPGARKAPRCSRAARRR